MLPQQGGAFACEYAGSNQLDESPILSLTPLNSDSGRRSWATPQAVAGLREGTRTPGVVVAVSKNEARIFKPPQARGAHRSWSDESSCHAACVTELEDYGICLSLIMDPGNVVSYSLPGLKLIGAQLSLRQMFEKERMGASRVLESGHILGWTGEHEIGLLYQWGKGVQLDGAAAAPADTLYNPNTPPAPRPTISSLQWLSGTQHVSIADLDLLIGGPDRPMSKKQQQALRTAANAEREAARQRAEGNSSGGGGGGGAEGEGVFANMARTMRERTEKLTFTTDTMERLEESSANFAEDVGKFVSQQKRKALLGGLTGKWF